MSTYTPYLALGITGDQVIDLLADDALRARWDRLPLGFTVPGVERLDPAATSSYSLEATVTATFLAAGSDRARLLAPVGFGRDHPYNVARRSASAGHLAGGRIGLVFTERHSPLPAGEPWLRPGEDPPHRFCDGLGAVRDLEQSWPYDAVLADRAAGVFVDSRRIDRVDADGAYRIAGPLTVPEPATGAGVLAWYSPRGGPTPVPADLSIGPDGQVVVLDREERTLSWTGAPDGLLLNSRPGETLPALLDAAEHLLGAGLRPTPPGPLRPALGVPLAGRTLDPAPACDLAEATR